MCFSFIYHLYFISYHWDVLVIYHCILLLARFRSPVWKASRINDVIRALDLPIISYQFSATQERVRKYVYVGDIECSNSISHGMCIVYNSMRIGLSLHAYQKLTTVHKFCYCCFTFDAHCALFNVRTGTRAWRFFVYSLVSKRMTGCMLGREYMYN